MSRASAQSHPNSHGWQVGIGTSSTGYQDEDEKYSLDIGYVVFIQAFVKVTAGHSDILEAQAL